MEDHIKKWMLNKICEREVRHNYPDLPIDFEIQATKRCFELIKPHFDKKRDIKLRIMASRAQTFRELYKIIEEA